MSSDAESIRCWIHFEGFCFLLFVRLFTNYVYIKKVLTESETMDFFSWLVVCGCFWFNYITKQPTLCKSLVSDHLQSCTPRSFSLLLYPGHLKKGPVCLEKQELTYSSETGCKTFSLLCLGGITNVSSNWNFSRVFMFCSRFTKPLRFTQAASAALVYTDPRSVPPEWLWALLLRFPPLSFQTWKDGSVTANLKTR